METRITELRSEMAKLQVELNMLRQMMGSLSRAEGDNIEQLQEQVTSQTFAVVGNLMPREQQAVQQLEQMKQIGSQLKQHVDHLSHLLNYGNRTPNTSVMSDPYSPALKDPMQRIY